MKKLNKNLNIAIAWLMLYAAPAYAQEDGSMNSMEYDQVQSAAGYNMSHDDAQNVGGWYVQQQQTTQDTTGMLPSGMTQTDYLEMQHQQDLYGSE